MHIEDAGNTNCRFVYPSLISISRSPPRGPAGFSSMNTEQCVASLSQIARALEFWREPATHEGGVKRKNMLSTRLSLLPQDFYPSPMHQSYFGAIRITFVPRKQITVPVVQRHIHKIPLCFLPSYGFSMASLSLLTTHRIIQHAPANRLLSTSSRMTMGHPHSAHIFACARRDFVLQGRLP